MTSSVRPTHARFRAGLIAACAVAGGIGVIMAGRLLSAVEQSDCPNLTNFQFVLSFKYKYGEYYYFASQDETVRVWYPQWITPTFR